MAKNAATNDRFNEIDQLIAENKATLKAAENHRELTQFAKDNGIDTAQDFGKFKFLLRKIGINYDELREETLARATAELADKADDLDEQAADAPVVRLWCAAVEDESTGTGSYAILDSEDSAIWYGKFFDDPKTIRKKGDQASAEQDVADKCVYVAGKAAQAAEEELVRLWLHTNYPELDKAPLRATGARMGVSVEIVVTEDDTAEQMAKVPGYRAFKSVPKEELKELLEYETEVEQTAETSTEDAEQEGEA